MCPELSVGPWSLSTYYLLHAAGTVGAGLLFFHLMVRDNAEPRIVRRIIGVMAFAGAAGAVSTGLVFALAAGRPLSGGLSGIGVLGGAFLGTLFYCRHRRIAVGPTVDRGAVAAALWLGVGRIGCAMAGCCYGRPTGGALGWNLPDIFGHWGPRYPTQLLSMAADLLIFGCLLFLAQRNAGKPLQTHLRPGDLGRLFATLYALKRLAIDSLRGDMQPVLGPLTPTQVAALVILAVTTVAAAARHSENRPWRAEERISGLGSSEPEPEPRPKPEPGGS